ncbi:hypothetical protein [Lysinibacillus sp. NPDC059133]|uniref:hypothetical protein n=1 Tax=Lysinibacillus sp. NPDC059133 TaxID=3346737 RepID=UPI00368B5076
MDELGQNTKNISLKIPDAYYQLSSPKLTDNDALGFKGAFSDYYTYTTDPNYNHELEVYSKYLKKLEKYGSFKVKDGYDLTDPPQPRTYVPDPIVWKTIGEELIFSSDLVNQTIFQTTFSGVKTNSRSLLTRVDDSFVGFRLDGPDTRKKNVTIEGK